MKTKLPLVWIMSMLFSLHAFSDRIYILNAGGYDAADPTIVTALTNMGHTVVVNNTTLTLPNGFTTTCLDSVNGYDWLCFFGDNDYSAMIPQVQTFINTGGKVYYQYEVTCCTTSSTSAAAVLTGVTGLSITPDVNGYVASSGVANVPGWEATNIGCCAHFIGNAYKGLDGIPLVNQWQATGTLNSGSPAISTCLNFGFHFSTTDFPGTAHMGGIVGVGDVNFFWDGGEPGQLPIDQAIVSYLFPNSQTTCYLFPPGCLQYPLNQTFSVNLGNDTSICQGDTLQLNANTQGATYLWQDGSTNPTFRVSQAGTYWVRVTSSCGVGSDTIQVQYGSPSALSLGPDTAYCGPFLRVLNTGIASTIWSTGDTAAQINVNTGGVYWAMVNSCGALVHDTVIITANNLPQVTVTGTPLSMCSGDTAQVCATAGFVSYNWNQGTNGTDCISTTLAGNYYVTVTDANNCTAQSNHLGITVFPSPPVSVSQNGDTLRAYGAVSYQWYLNGQAIPGATSAVYIGANQGSYTLAVTDTNGCTEFSNAVIVNSVSDLLADKVLVYPNPLNQASFHLVVGGNLLGGSLEIYDDNGRIIYNAEVMNLNSEISLNVAQGIYLLRIANSRNSVVMKLVKM